MQTVRKGNEGEKHVKGIETYYKTLGLGSFGMSALSAEIDVKDGRIVRTRGMHFDREYTAEELRPWTLEAKGKKLEGLLKNDIPPFALVYKKRAYSDNRILYPMKRVDWDPEGERNPQNRGKSKFERISWDEATDIIAKELHRIEEKYGYYAVFCQGDGHGETKTVHATHGCQMRLMSVLGGFTFQARNPDSWEGWYWGAKHVWGCDPVGEGDIGLLLLDIAENSKYLLHWGCDEETTPWGWLGQLPSRWCFWLTEVGVKQIYVCPDVNYGAAVHADKWIPVNPNTDVALHMAIAYTWIENGWFDQEYVDTHSVGFDWVKYYVMGGEDGIPKTPKWAEPICGVPSRQIKALAKAWYKSATSISHVNGGSLIRSQFSAEPGRMEVVLMGMQGLGKPGRNVIKLIEWGLYGLPSQCPNPRSELYMMPAAAYRSLDYNNPSVWDIRQSFIPKTMVPKAILGDYTVENPLTWYGTGIAGWPKEDQFVQYQYPSEKAGTRIHMIWSDTPCWSTCWNGGYSLARAVQSDEIEFVLIQHPWMENDCIYADILLPINTKFEERDIAVDSSNGYTNVMMIEPRCIEPRGESKSDYEAVGEIAKKMGVYDEFTGGKTEEEWIREGFEHSGCEERISWEEFKEKGYYAAPTAEDWEAAPRGFAPFCEDPEANPLGTPSGKLEFYSTALAHYFPDDQSRAPYPKYITEDGRLSESLLTERGKKYPYLIVSNHPRWRVHANMDDVTWFREIETCKVAGPDGYLYEPVWINPIDAELHEIETGDVVKIFNDRGWVLGGAYVTERIKPGVIYQDHGARLDPIKVGEADRGGANNLIAPSEVAMKNTNAEVTSGYLVDFEKVDVFELAKQYPEAFSREFNATGVKIDNWLV